MAEVTPCNEQADNDDEGPQYLVPELPMMTDEGPDPSRLAMWRVRLGVACEENGLGDSGDCSSIGRHRQAVAP